MRYLKLIIAGLVLIYLIYRLLPFYYTITGKKSEGYIYKEMIANSTISISYLIDEEKWLVFPFEVKGELLRVVTNANLPKNINLKKEGGWEYSLRYQITGKGGAVLLDRTHHLHSKITFYKDDRLGEFTSSFYTETDIIPADSRGFRINISHLKDADAIRFILLKKDKDIKDVSLRIYTRYEPKERILGYMWRRFSEKKRERLAMGNIYPPQLLTEYEKKRILQSQWRPLGPLGAKGKDFIPKNLYVLKEVEAEEIDIYIPPIGIFIKGGHHATVPVPEGGGNLRIEFYNNTEAEPHDIRLFWYGREIEQFFERTIKWKDPTKTSIESFFDTGLIDIYSEDPIGLKAFLIKGKEEKEITPEPVYMRAYISDLNKPVTFHISHHGESPTPFKASLRLILREDIKPASYAIYELLNQEDKVVYRGKLPLNPIASFYDTLSGNYLDVEVSEAQDYYFYLPAEVDGIRFYSDTEVIVTGYTRPDNMVRSIDIPEDYLPSTLLEEKEPSWFAIRPAGYWSLIYEARSVILIINRRPPERREELIEGRYEWEDYVPEGRYQAYYVLTDEIKDVKPDRESPDYYFPLRTDTDNTILLREIKGLNTIAPTLLYILKGDGRSDIKVYVDDRPVLNTKVYGNIGEIRLSPLKFGKHKIRIESSHAGEFYINNIRYTGGPIIFKRFTSRLKKEGISFLYRKATPFEEVLSVRFYAPSGNNQRSIIDVSIEADREADLRPFNKWTFLRRRFSIRPDDSNALPMLYAPDKYLQPGQLLFIPVGEDLPPGTYRITFMPVSGTGYISLHKITPGEYEEFRFYNERVLNYEDIYY